MVVNLGAKYNVVLVEHPDKFEFYATRYGEPWRDLVGDNLVFAMFDKILELEAEIRRMKEEKHFNEKD